MQPGGELPFVGRGVEQDAARRQAVAPGTTGLLVVGLDALRQVVVNDRAHIGFVHAHPERDRRGQHTRRPTHKAVLDAVSIGDLRVVVLGGDPRGAQPRRQLLAGVARPRIHDDRPRDGPAEIDDRGELLAFVGGVQHLEAQVWPEDRGADGRHVAQVRLDLGLGVGGGRGGERQHRRRVERTERAADEEIVGPETDAPERDTVGLVDDDAGHTGAAQRVDEGLLAQPLGRDIDQLVATFGDATQPRRDLAAVERAMDRRCACGQRRRQVIDLVFHERDQRREHQCRAGQQQRGQLVGQRLAGAGRQHRQRGLAAQHLRDHGGLAGAEGVVTEVLAQGDHDLICQSWVENLLKG